MTISRRTMLTVPSALTAAGMLGRTPLRLIGTAEAATAPVTFDLFSLKINGKRVYHWCGEFHYWRLPSPDLWRDVLHKYKAGGFTAASVYFHWGYHSPAPGVYDFTGVRDIDRLLRMAAEIGIYIVARPGPYIGAETNSGGLPGWVDAQAGVARTTAPDYLSAALEWYANVNAILAPHQIARGGPIILYQIENEYSASGAVPIAYMEALEGAARASGITVPLFVNDSRYPLTAGYDGIWTPGTPGGTNIYAWNAYPNGLDAATPTVWMQVPDVEDVRTSGAQLNPLDLAEAQGGSTDPWGGYGFAAAYELTDPAFNRIFYKNNIAGGMTMQSIYMLFGGTSWGWLPQQGIYTSYDYGGAVTEGRQLTDKFAVDKNVGYFVASVRDVCYTALLADVAATNAAIRVRHSANPRTLTQFFTILHADSTSTVFSEVNFPISLPDASYESVPQFGSLIVNGRDAKLLVAGYALDHHKLMYSTSEIMTHGHLGSRDAAVFYGRHGEAGETVLRFSGEPEVESILGSVTTTFDPASGDLRLNYTHSGLVLVQIKGGGTPLLLAICDDATAATFWRMDVGTTPVVVQGPSLVRSVSLEGTTAVITGDTASDSGIVVFTSPAIETIVWNGAPVASSPTPFGALVGAIAGPRAVVLPDLTGWRTQFETPEAKPDFDDASWLDAANTTTNNPTKQPAGQVVLYADDYGFHNGDVWYRARFDGTGSETGITLDTEAVSPGRFSVWINGHHAGDGFQTGTAQTIAFPAGSVRGGETNVVSILVANYGHSGNHPLNDGNKQPRGLISYALVGSSAELAWKIQGCRGGETLPDPTRGPYNNGGLFGEREGWYLPGYPTSTWTPTSLPASNTAPGVTWYSTEVTLDLPAGQDVSIGLEIMDRVASDYQLRIFVNGWNMGLYASDVGPQTAFVIPNGVLRTNGRNRVSIASWSFGDMAGGLGDVSLVLLGNVAGGVTVAPNRSPGYADVFG